MMAPLKRANTDLVGVAWLRLVPRIDSSAVATRLPRYTTGDHRGEVDVSKLRTSGFVVWRSGIGGAPSGKLRRPVGVAECWAAPAEGSIQVPWGRASDLAENIFDAATDEFSALDNVAVSLPAGYPAARVLTVRALGEPQKVTGDPSGFARFDINIEINWTELA